MICVILAAGERNNSLCEMIRSVTGKHLSCIQANGDVIASKGRGHELLVVEASGQRRIEADHIIIIFGEAEQINIASLIADDIIAVVDSGNEELLSYVAATGLTAITCGLSARDTVTLSSIRQDSAVLNFQRSVTCFDGTTSEPQEIPVRLRKKTDSFGLMAAASICLLSGGKIHSP